LVTAASRARGAVIDLLLEAGAKLEHHDSRGRTPFFLAVEHGHVETARQLHGWGADVNCADRAGVTPLMLAAQQHDPAFCRWLVQRGAEVDVRDSRGTTALQTAVANGGYETSVMLIHAGANPRQTTREGLNLATAALRENHGRLAAKINEYAVEGLNLETPGNVLDAIMSNEVGLLRRRLEEFPQDVHQRTQSSGWTPLLFAVRQGNLAMVRLLLEQGADPNAANMKGKTPMHEAAGRGDAGIVKELLAMGADIEVVYKGLTAGETAARAKHLAVERLLGVTPAKLKKSSNF